MLIPSHLLNEHYDDRYFDVVNAIEEAKHIFFEGSRLIRRLSALQAGKGFSIGETGFGAGRVLVSLMDFLEGSGLTGLDIAYNSVELHPITAGRMRSILEGFRPQAGQLIDLLVNEYGQLDITKAGWHRMHFLRTFGRLTLNLWIGEAMEMVNALEAPCDAWFLDGHGPKKNPTIWRPELLLAIGDKTVPNGTCATYTVSVAVRRSLSEAGFELELRPGFGGKKSVLCGRKTAQLTAD